MLDCTAVDGFDVQYVKHDMQPISEGHALLLTEATSTNKSTGAPLLDGFGVSVHQTVDLDKGSGPQLGYVIFAEGPVPAR